MPDTPSVVRTALRGENLSPDDAIELAQVLWSVPVQERRAAATMALIKTQDHI